LDTSLHEPGTISLGVDLYVIYVSWSMIMTEIGDRSHCFGDPWMLATRTPVLQHSCSHLRSRHLFRALGGKQAEENAVHRSELTMFGMFSALSWRGNITHDQGGVAPKQKRHMSVCCLSAAWTLHVWVLLHVIPTGRFI